MGCSVFQIVGVGIFFEIVIILSVQVFSKNNGFNRTTWTISFAMLTLPEATIYSHSPNIKHSRKHGFTSGNFCTFGTMRLFGIRRMGSRVHIHPMPETYSLRTMFTSWGVSFGNPEHRSFGSKQWHFGNLRSAK